MNKNSQNINQLWYGKDPNNPKQFLRLFPNESTEAAISMLSYGTKILKHKIGSLP